uniref:C2H2-type domain-containing protein n=1 Tax=Strongyloides papillosus TaxID=174720 RepID=A0A0N5BA13_STREA
MSMRSDNSFYCFICNKIFTSDERRYHHFEKHINYNRFKCLECDSQFSTYDDLECHQECFQHFDFKKTTNLGIRKLITSLMELSLKIEASSDMDSVEFSVTVKSEKSITSDSESAISNDSEENTIDNGKAEDESLISNIKTEVVNVTTVEKDNDPNHENSNDSDRKSASNNIFNGNENLHKPVKMKYSEYLCLRSLDDKIFIEKEKIIDECLQCNRTFLGGKRKIQHVFKDHLMLNEFNVLECMYCLNQKGTSKKFFNISSVQEHYKSIHKFSNSGCPNNLAWNYNEEEQYIHVNGSDDLLLQYETQFDKCFVKHC